MTDKILTSKTAIEVAQKLHNQNKKIVLAGGCFDILHLGHITFLEKAKEKGDCLFVFVEHDSNIKQKKGPKRPINTQDDRAKILVHLTMVDYVIKLPEISDNQNYDDLVIRIKPAIIATTAGDTSRSHKERQAKIIDAQVVDVTPPISNQSTSRLVSIFNEL